MASTNSPGSAPVAAPQALSLSRRARLAVSGAFAAVLGLLPHVLHHAGPLAGAALLGGVAGSLLFGLLGLVAAIPFLIRMHRRSGSWRAPAVALTLFAAVFSISTFVVGPAISGADEGADGNPTQPAPAAPANPSGGSSHEQHHD